MKFFQRLVRKPRSKTPFRLSFRQGKRPNGFLFSVGIVLAGLLVCGGCRRHDETPIDVPTVSTAPQTDLRPHADDPADRLEADPDLKPEELLRDVIDVYHRSKVYSDQGFVETVYEINGAPVTYRYRASVTLQKPNNLRMEIADGILVCDGENFWGKILDPFYEKMILKKEAPLLLSSIRDLYPDIRLADAMDLPVPPNIFWVPPQMILLLAKEPLKTLAANNADLKLMEPRLLHQKADDGTETKIPCDRIAVTVADGTRVFWISRETKGVVRIELPLEQLQAPEGVQRVLELSMNFPNQILSDEAPSSSEIEPGMFSIPHGADEKIVDHFLPAEQFFYGKKAPSIRLSPLLSGDSPIQLDDPKRHIRVYALWGGAGESPTVWNRSQAFLREIKTAAAMFANNKEIEFYAVNVDPPQRSVADVISDYGDLSIPFPLYRINRSDLKKSAIAGIAVPSLIFVDQDGVVQKYYSRPISYVTIQFQLVLLIDGKNLYQSDIAAFQSLETGFEETVRAAEENDVYLIKTDLKGEEPEIAEPRKPVTFSLEKVWEQSLIDPANPLPITDSIATNNGETGTGEPAVASDRSFPAESILIPYGGNMIALLDSNGKILQNKTTSAGEPVSFIRTLKTQRGNRFFAASSFLDTHKVYLYDGALNLLGTLDVNEPRQQWVADIRLNDVNKDNQPELLMALVGDSASNLIPIHGIYSVPIKTDQVAGIDEQSPVHWKDEFVVNPFRLGFVYQKDDDGSFHKKLWGLSFPAENMGKLVEDSLLDGRRFRTVSPPENVSILWFASHPDESENVETESVAALIARTDATVPSFAILSDNGAIQKETPLEKASWSDHLERIQSGDINGDGTIEWIVPTREGVLHFFDGTGNLFDSFAFGKEVTGTAIAHWQDKIYLIITHPTGVIAYKVAPPKTSESPTE